MHGAFLVPVAVVCQALGGPRGALAQRGRERHAGGGGGGSQLCAPHRSKQNMHASSVPRSPRDDRGRDAGLF